MLHRKRQKEDKCKSLKKKERGERKNFFYGKDQECCSSKLTIADVAFKVLLKREWSLSLEKQVLSVKILNLRNLTVQLEKMIFPIKLMQQFTVKYMRFDNCFKAHKYLISLKQ